jgi:hypothetical protein
VKHQEDTSQETLLDEFKDMLEGVVFKRKVANYWVYAFALEFKVGQTHGGVTTVQFNPKTKKFTTKYLKYIYRFANYNRIPVEEQKEAKQMMKRAYVKRKMRPEEHRDYDYMNKKIDALATKLSTEDEDF